MDNFANNVIIHVTSALAQIMISVRSAKMVFCFKKTLLSVNFVIQTKDILYKMEDVLNVIQLVKLAMDQMKINA